MKLKIFTTLIFTLITTQVKAEIVDATSAGLAGNTIGVGNTAFSAQRNPASMTDINKYSFIIPLSTTISFLGTSSNFNSYFKDISSFSNTLDKSPKGFLDSINTEKLFNSSAKDQGSYFIHNEMTLGNLGISGTIFSILGKNIYGGLNTWSKLVYSSNTISPNILSFDKFSTSNILDSFKDTDTKMQDLNQIIKPTDNIFKSFDNYISTQKFILPVLAYDLNQDKKSAEKLINELTNFKKDVLSTQINSYTKSFSQFEKSVSNILDLANTFSELKNFKSTNIADGHTVVAFSTASKLFKIGAFELSLGVNFKGFIFPYNPSFSKNHSYSILDINNSNKNLFPLNIRIESDSNFDNTSKEIKNYYENNLKKIYESSKKVSDKIKQLDAVVPVAIDRLKNSQAIPQGDINNLKTNFSSLSKELVEADNLYNQIIDSSNKSFSDINKVLINDLSKAKFNLYRIEEVSPFGFGADIGLQAKAGDDLIFGIMAENPFVFWQGKIRKNELSFDPNKINFEQPLKFNTDSLLKSMLVKKGSKLENFNYNLSEPFIIKVGGSYNLSKASTFLKDTTISVGVDQFFDGRNSTVGIALEKAWFFQKASLFLRSGTQLGGLNNMTTFGFGAKSASFRFDIAYGASDLLSLWNSKTAVFACSSSFSF